MSKLEFIFTSDASSTHDASVTEVSEVLEVCYNHGWSLAPEVSGLDGSPTYSIEVANINSPTQFAPYKTETLDADILQPFDDTHINWLYVRINYKAVDNTTGTVKFEMILK